MTREEAIAIFKGFKFLPREMKAVEMAIKALEQEPCEDTISRKSIKQKLQEHHDFFVNAYGGFSNLPQNDKSRVDEITNCIAMVVNEPSVTPQEPQETVSKEAYDHEYFLRKELEMKIAKLEHDKNVVLDKIKKDVKGWYWQADKQRLAKDPCVVDAMIDLFIRTINKYKAERKQDNKMKRLRIYFHILGTKIYYKEVASVEEAKTVIDAIAGFTNAKVDEGIFPDHCSTAGLEEYDEEEKEWILWHDENGLDFDEHFIAESDEIEDGNDD